MARGDIQQDRHQSELLSHQLGLHMSATDTPVHGTALSYGAVGCPSVPFFAPPQNQLFTTAVGAVGLAGLQSYGTGLMPPLLPLHPSHSVHHLPNVYSLQSGQSQPFPLPSSNGDTPTNLTESCSLEESF